MFMSGMTHASRPARPVSSCRRRAQSGARTAELPVSELAPIRSDFLPARRRSAVLARVLATALCLSVCLCPSQVGILSKRLNESSWFLARELPSTYLHYVKGNSGISKNKGTSLS